MAQAGPLEECTFELDAGGINRSQLGGEQGEEHFRQRETAVAGMARGEEDEAGVAGRSKL